MLYFEESEKHLNFLLRKMVSKSMVNGIIASLVICSKTIIANRRVRKQTKWYELSLAVWVACLVEAKAKVVEANGDPIEKPKGDDSLRVDWLRLKEAQALRYVERAESHQQVPACQCRR